MRKDELRAMKLPDIKFHKRSFGFMQMHGNENVICAIYTAVHKQQEVNEKKNDQRQTEH